jgi:L-xylulose reductase
MGGRVFLVIILPVVITIIVIDKYNIILLCMQVPGVITECIDVTDLDAVKKAVESLAPIHLLVNNAGVTRLQHFLDVTTEAYDQ